MNYRFRADIIYPGTAGGWDALNDLVEEARRRIGDAIVIHEKNAKEERSYFEVEECYHDESPTQACLVLERWEAGKGQVV